MRKQLMRYITDVFKKIVNKKIISPQARMYLYHYYDRDLAPFKNISELPDEEAEKIMQRLKAEKSNAFCNQRNEEYLEKRRYYEDILRRDFLKKGGTITRQVPQYMVVGNVLFYYLGMKNRLLLK